jgi:alpha-galactosidase/6-phospho-beta-glucosidase family protein
MRIAELTVDAAVKRSRKLALQALLLDPMINDLEVAERILADFQRAHKGLMPELR